VIDDLDRRLAPRERELRPLAGGDERAKLPMTSPGVAELLGLAIASEIGDISRFRSARNLVAYSGLTPRIRQSAQSQRVGRLSKAGVCSSTPTTATSLTACFTSGAGPRATGALSLLDAGTPSPEAGSARRPDRPSTGPRPELRPWGRRR
jgi:hypothetical protein